MKAVLYSALTVCVLAPAHAQLKPSNERTLLINDTLASERLQRVGDSVMVPIADVAKALGLTVVKTSKGYALVKDGGANQVEGVRGKLGETVFDGKWRLTVTNPREVPSYTLETKTATDYGLINPIAKINGTTYEPKPGYRLLVYRCEVKNGQKSAQQLWWYQSDTHTALADASGESFPPILTDIASEAFQSKPLLPGAKLEFNLVFCVPTSANPRELVFTLRTVADKGSDVRISLTDPNLNANRGGKKR
ncbi:hypothetical protein [Armatimonas rosea]|uniref:Copper amine oxidase N-terminal domain-containing protein n=1 Tax=Armatimonas rosea TaxID=685828 RepID=A0A7W9SUS8_ARMRO|nr:hypothetical protein [Armatimonas rosea]MBB6052334.1 hypothetical protein [Armatimonas rosea]